MATMQAMERLYLTADKKALVGEGDKRAATLYAAVGDYIPDSAAERFGLVGGKLKPAKTAGGKGAGGGSSKENKSGADKEQKGGEDKGGQDGGSKDEGAGATATDEGVKA